MPARLFREAPRRSGQHQFRIPSVGKDREQVVLLHGFTSTSRIWDEVVEALGDAYDVHAPAALGHRGGRMLPNGETYTIEATTDALVEDFDALGLERPHIVGNSMGGWLALELAVRSRAASVFALCPAGFWDGSDDPYQAHLRKIFVRTRRQTLLSRPLLGITSAIPAVRRYAFRNVAGHGNRLSREAVLEAAAGVLECRAYPDFLEGPPSAGARSFYEVDCPVAVRLAERDRYFPPERYVSRIEKRVHGAEMSVLPGLGHVPMVDDPGLIAREIADWVNRCSPQAAQAHGGQQRGDPE